MNAKSTRTKIAALAATLLAGTAFLAAPAAQAATIVAADQAAVSQIGTSQTAAKQTGTVIAQDQTSMIQPVPSAPRAVTVTADPGTVVTLSAKSATTQTKKADKQGRATFTRLIAGRTYTVAAGGETTTVTPAANVGKSSDLTVRATDRVDTVDLTWAHKNTKARATLGYTVTATPANSVAAPITVEARTTSTQITGLDPNALYSFSVAAHNALGYGQPSVARMTRSLADITGRSTTRPIAQDDDATKTPAPTPNTNRTPAPAPAPAPAPQPGPAPQPSTRTIWVCPEGFADVSGVCTQSRAYTYSSVKETQPYTYRTEQRYEPCTGGDCPGSEYRNFGTDWSGTTCPNGGTMHGGQCLGWTTGYKWVSYSIKDAPPMGWYDDGSQFARDVQVKDPTPTGWSDNGTEWIRTTAKVEKVVPA